MAWIYLTLDQAIEVHARTVEISGGGTLGNLDLGMLDSVLQHIQNDEYYPSFEDKLTHLFFSACKFHCFQDGNKRVAIALCAQMLLLNGYLRSIEGFIRDSENISYHVASGNISKGLLGEWMAAVLCGREEEEALKLKILNAISMDTP
ncbi:MAG: type II toxin-antitoxin system death-on-curing family toxin [Deltaproteobacteria bacterium CG23_combo_of_CG06-09_8_20_14_all_51_20]|nr:MAG: type II toxin-antitoxin system death-on-curing family toxin [Deltaproteobacteria bacterium CG23_combo_of_CG06-09_8_20_14_all_51_20]PIY24710.1 MAG: type II toxin-antitoxin system death-on-curing family toxin [Deltaproteobacteria bacterium CG_4_10_14_3_um_filter_51_14]PJB35830.1 MAG: type II toxin-antitoxin system death-on-curing family toxin [Deltaproteobacteria bacterium CG_4_9_14_3_um_filter_51_14]